MARYFEPDEIRPELLLQRNVAVLGYGNQGRPQALNLRDQGVNVRAGIRPGSLRRDVAASDGIEVMTLEDASAWANVVMLTLPDPALPTIYEASVAPNIQSGSAVLFCHGFAVHFGGLSPASDLDVALVGPKGAGSGVRSLYEAGKGIPSLIAVHQDATGLAEQIAVAYGWGIGSGRSFMLATTFAEETETDLFGEQAVLCGGIPALIRAGFETLVAAGYQEEVAYFECLHECKIIIDLLVERGPLELRKAISDTAEWGGQLAGPRLVTDRVRQEMRQILLEIQNGAFASTWIEEAKHGSPNLVADRELVSRNQLEAVSRDLRRRLGLS